MIQRTNGRRVRAGVAAAALLAGSAVAGCDYTEPIESDPNAVPAAGLDQLFTGIQVNAFFFNESQAARLASMWIQQMAGTTRQFQILDEYVFNDQEGDDIWDRIYRQGGLVDIRNARALAEAEGRRTYAGILKIHEAFLIGMAASIWGDIPYSQAGQPEEFPTPKLDEQLAVYDAVIALLDEAIADLASGQGIGPAEVDLNFGGDPARWTAVAHSLKARYFMHLAESRGMPAYQNALAAAQQGISSADGNWLGLHSDVITESNLWFQFTQLDRSGYISAGAFLVELLKARADPRLGIYFTQASGAFAGQYLGSPPGTPPGDPSTAASQLNVPGQPAYDQPILTCAETQFIIAEAALALGDAGTAQTAANAGIACQEVYWGVMLPDLAAVTLEEIITQKYIANFLNMEIWNDYQRTCLPAIQTFQGRPVPPRLFYPVSERQTNPNIPAPVLSRNADDPNPCP